jgi:predicted MFS family arabinose efflux permease
MSRYPATPSLHVARLALAVSFFVFGSAYGTFVTRIPLLQRELGLDNAELGLVLLGPSFGSLAALLFSGWFVVRVGSRNATLDGCLALATCLPVLALARSAPTLFLALACYGACTGVTNVGANVHAVAIEERYGRSIISSFHAIFSLGELAGALTGGAALALGIPSFPHFLGVAVVIAIVSVAASRFLLRGRVDRLVTEPRFVLPTRALLGLGVLLTCSSFIENSMRNWSAVYVTQLVGSASTLAALAYATYSGAITAGRLAGDFLVQRFGPTATVRSGGLLGAIGLGSALILGTPQAALAAFACVGVGVAVAAPLVFSASGRVPNVAPSVGLASVSLMGFVGSFVGSPIIGFAANAFSLRLALGLIVLLALGMSALSPALAVGSVPKAASRLGVQAEG